MAPRLWAAFDWRDLPSAEVAKRIDAWIDPPHYTGQPPILLRQLATSGAHAAASAPEGSTLVLRAPSEFAAKVSGGLAAPEKAPANDAGERRWTLKSDGALTLTASGLDFSSVDISVIPATPPTIAFDGEPIANASGSLTLGYKIDDRYGAQSAEAVITLADPGQEAALADPPQMPLSLPASENGLGQAKTTTDLSEHPWAGAKVKLVLKATNLAGAVGLSAPKIITLPERLFHNPLARALIEQRRDLILDPQGKRAHVDKALAALEIEPEMFGETDGVYLGLRAVRARIGDDADKPSLQEAAELLWAIALRLEDGSSSQAQRDLRNAEKDLRDALKRGASDEEIKALTQKLREAAERYMQELAKNAPDTPQTDADLDAQDIESMLDKLEDQARNGAREDAEAMLDNLQNMFENLQADRQGQGQNQQAMRKAARRARQAAARAAGACATTLSAPTSATAPPRPIPSQDDSQSLKDRQDALQKRLEEMQKRLDEMGMDSRKRLRRRRQGDGRGRERSRPGRGAIARRRQIARRRRQPRPGQGEGGKGDKGAAVEAQGRALQALRDGAKGLQGQMNAQGQGQGQGPGGRVGMALPGQHGRGGRDPLGRNGPQDAKGASNGTLGDTEGAAQRARRVMEELRRRLADPNRDSDELDYFERLLKRF